MRDYQSVRADESMSFDPGLKITVHTDPLGFSYGPDVFGPEPEYRRLADIRASLLDTACDGPDPVYAIAMDVGEQKHRAELERRNLVFGLVTYAAGALGREPVRSQGHIHRVSAHSGWSPPELYEVWRGQAIIYMQESMADQPGRCFAIEAACGDVVVVPPGWPHATVSAGLSQPLTFAAWCDREYGFLYDEVRSKGGLAWYPILDGHDGIQWKPNPRFRTSDLTVRSARGYPELGIHPRVPIYTLFGRDPSCVQWVSDPASRSELWNNFEP